MQVNDKEDALEAQERELTARATDVSNALKKSLEELRKSSEVPCVRKCVCVCAELCVCVCVCVVVVAGVCACVLCPRLGSPVRAS
jgi:hypothetical protein